MKRKKFQILLNFKSTTRKEMRNEKKEQISTKNEIAEHEKYGDENGKA